MCHSVLLGIKKHFEITSSTVNDPTLVCWSLDEKWIKLTDIYPSFKSACVGRQILSETRYVDQVTSLIPKCYGFKGFRILRSRLRIPVHECLMYTSDSCCAGVTRESKAEYQTRTRDTRATIK